MLMYCDIPRPNYYQVGVILFSRSKFGSLEDIFQMSHLGGCFWWVEARDADKLPIVYTTAPCNKNIA